MNFDQIFRAYDIRGIFGKDLTEETVSKIGSAFGIFLEENGAVVIGRDVRLSGEALREALISGLIRNCNVTDIGVVPTPTLYFAIKHLKKDAGIMITASHNPPEWNGLKLFKKRGCIYGSEMERIKELAKEVSLTSRKAQGGTDLYDGIIRDYTEFVLSKVKVHRKLRVGADTSNGVCGLVAPSIFRRLGCEIFVLNEKPDGRFPAHSPEPKEETLGQLKEEVVKNGADFGVGYDADGDRAVFVDEKGKLIPGDLTLLIFIKDALEKNKGGKIVYEVSCSMAVDEFTRKHGGIPIVERVGHTFIMDRIISEGALLGGEKSSHFYFSECYGIDDATFASLRMAEILSKGKEKLSEIVHSLPKYPSVYEENFDCSDNLKFKVIEKLKVRFKDLGLKFLDMDGVKLLDENGWVLLRASNTQPIIRVSAEAKTEKKLKKLHDFAVEELQRALKGD